MIPLSRRFVSACTLAGMAGLAQAQAPAFEPALEEMVVTASRTAKPLSSVPNTVTLIDAEALNQQLAIHHDLSTVLGNLVPGFSPSRQKLTNSGETLRGRSPLYLIDGVPQSNPLRDGSRDGFTIDPAMIERVEVIHGANAIHGMGASGGIINLITKTPGETREQALNVDLTAPTDYDSDALTSGVSYSYSDRIGGWDLLFSGSLRDSGVYTDSEGRVIGVDTTQGDTMDSESRDIFIKTGYRWDGQSLHLMINDFTLEGDGDWLTVPGDIDAGIPTTAERGELEGVPPTNDVRTISLDYRVDDVLGHSVHAQLFDQSFAGTYGGGTFGTFQDPAFGESIYDQSQNESDKLGFKLTLANEAIGELPLGVVWGFDALKDKTTQVLVQTGRAWVPESEYENIAPFVQLEYTGIERLVLTGGVRHENSTLEVDDYTTLASYGSQQVSGGSPSFSETLPNLGFTYRLSDAWRLFGNVSEGSSMPDVGRVLRGVDQPGVEVESFLNLEPVVSDNRELGLAFDNGRVGFEISYYQSDSDYGARLALNDDGIYDLKREKTEIAGIEANGDWKVSAKGRVGFAYSNPEGEYDFDGDNRVDTDLGGSNISPERLNLFWEHQWTQAFDTRLQASHLRDRQYRDASGAAYADFDGYTLLDVTTTWYLGEGQLRASLQNLTNEEYVTYYSQTQARDDRYFMGRGRTLGVSYTLRF